MSPKMFHSHKGPLIIAGAVLIFIVPFLVISGIVISKTYKRIRLNNICVDYYTEQYAWVVDKNGKGIDSVSVTLKDNANFNLISGLLLTVPVNLFSLMILALLPFTTCPFPMNFRFLLRGIMIPYYTNFNAIESAIFVKQKDRIQLCWIFRKRLKTG